MPFIVLGALAAALVITLIVVAVVRATDQNSAAGGSSPSPRPKTASDAVKGYLDALVAGDAETALQFVDQPPKDRTFLTDAVLKESAKEAPISGVKVGKPAGAYGVQVTAGYRVGDEPVTQEFNVIKRGGNYRIDDGTSEVRLGSQATGLDLTVNGVAPDGAAATVFPGRYRIETTTQYIELGSDATFTVLTPVDDPVAELEPKLSSKGQQLFRTKVTAATKKCVASTKLKTGCDLQLSKKLSDGTKLTDGTVHRTMPASTKSELRHLKAELDPSSPTVAEGSLTGSIDVRVDGTKDGQSISQGEIFGFGTGTQLGRPTIDMSADDLVVEWE